MEEVSYARFGKNNVGNSQQRGGRR